MISTVADAGRFADWIVTYQIAPSGLARYYHNGPHAHEESPMATAYAILFFVPRDVQLARRFGNALLDLQSVTAGNRFVGGGVPSIANDRSQQFYSSDALICVKALVALWRVTHDERYRKGASRFLEFIDRMVDGASHGMLVHNLGFPMQYVTPDGAFQNHLVPNVAMLFWDALRDYGTSFSDAKALAIFEEGRRFLIEGTQAPNGAFYDHYDPGYPAVPYSSNRWRWFKIESNGHAIAIGDNMMMSALGAQTLGAHVLVDRFLSFMSPEAGAFYAYIDIETRGSGFTNGDRPYIDVVDSAMYGMLMQRAGRGPAAALSDVKRVLARSRTPSGGFRWGQYLGDGWVDGAAEALVTGYWAQLVS